MWGSNLLTATTTLTAKQCGPPSYGCSRSDLAVSQVPSPVPNMGGTIGLNTIVTPSDFNVPILRATDSTTSGGLSFSVTPTGAGADNLWDNANNWTPTGGPPGINNVGDTAIFDGTAGNAAANKNKACTVATALLHSQSLSPFEFSVWFSTSGR